MTPTGCQTEWKGKKILTVCAAITIFFFNSLVPLGLHTVKKKKKKRTKTNRDGADGRKDCRVIWKPTARVTQ